MKKCLLSLIIILINSSSVYAEVAVNIQSAIDSRIYSTQGSQPFDTLERNNYTNTEIMNLEQKSTPRTEIKNESKILPVQEEKGIKGLFKGFRVIW